MAVHGYVTHAARSRRFAGLLLLLYVVAFELTGAFALALFLLIRDPRHTIFSDPLGYALRYALPIALLSAFSFWKLYNGHAKAVADALGVRIVTRLEEPRFVTIAEQACTALGIRLPRFGVIEVPELNALTVGEGPTAGLLVATRGLLDGLDDDELAAVFAHEASHIRQGDTRVLAANHALMRTAVLWQVHNPLRVERWQQLILFVLLPPMLVLVLASGAVTTLSMRIARFARQAIRLSRDHVADGEAVRVTHFPEALLSALQKIGGRGAFIGSRRFEDLLFDGRADYEGGRHPSINDRLKAITALGGGLMDDSRHRRDTRTPARPRFGRSLPSDRTIYPTDREGRPLQQPPTGGLRIMALRFTDPDAYRQWRQASIAWWEWRVSDRRNLFGITPKLVIPAAMVCVFSAVFWWPADNDWRKFTATFSPSTLAQTEGPINSGPTCGGVAGLCPGYHYSQAQLAAKREEAAATEERIAQAKAGPPSKVYDDFMSLFLLVVMVVGLARPSLLKRFVGVVDPTPEQLGARSHTALDMPPRPTEPIVPTRPGGFGRKRI